MAPPAALDGDDRILYDSATGRLLHDPDGTLHRVSIAPAVLFATISNHATQTYPGFCVL